VPCSTRLALQDFTAARFDRVDDISLRLWLCRGFYVYIHTHTEKEREIEREYIYDNIRPFVKDLA
jgi:hypothetical protein